MQGTAVAVRDGSALEGIHLLWYGEPSWGYSPRGFTILRRAAERRRPLVCDRLDGRPLEVLHRGHVYRLPLALVRWRPVPCPQPLAPLPTEDVQRSPQAFDPRGLRPEARATLTAALRERTVALRRREEGAGGEAASAAHHVSTTPFAVAAPVTPPVGVTPGYCRRYQLDIGRPRAFVRLTFGTPAMLVVALNGEAAIRAELVSGPYVSRFELAAPAITRLVVYTVGTQFIELCVPEDEGRAWDDKVEVLARSVQLPVREVNREVRRTADELALAQSRMLQAPRITDGEFKRAASYLRRLVAPRPWPPAERILLERNDPQTGFSEFGLLALALLPQVDADGRRMLGLAYRDAHELERDRVYDYRITGYFPEIDVRDRLLSFRLVPSGTVLPTSFYLEDVRLRLPVPTPVSHHPVPLASQTAEVVRRGIRLAADAAPGLRLDLPEPLGELTLELEPAAGTLHVRGVGPGPLGLGSHVDERTVALRARVTLIYDPPVERLELSGEAFFYALRLHGVTGARRDPDRMLAVHLDLLGVRFANTPPPPPPGELAVANLQAPLVPVAPEVAVTRPPQALGFRLTWRQPFEGAPPLWPVGESFAPPVGVTTFVIERRRMDEPSDWATIGVRQAFGARLAKPGIGPLSPDVDLMEHFGGKARGAPPDDFFTLDDVLAPPDGPAAGPPGSLWQYRIASVDAVGRRSATWTASAVLRLEKHVPPPAPAPPARAVPGQAEALGVQARLIQRADPDVSDAEKDAVLGPAHGNAIVLRWSWPDSARAHDPWTREFRVYFRARPGTELTGLLTSVAATATEWEGRIDWDRELAANALNGLRLTAGAHGFRIEGHDAGRLHVRTRLRRLALDPAAAPGAGPVVLQADPGGAEGRPALFDGRARVVPLVDGQTEYETVLFDLVALAADTPRRTVWVGVSAADDQPYVADALPADRPNGGRPGNESVIVTRPVSGRYHGQPRYVVPDPLAFVPERVTDEPRAADVRVRLPLPALVRTAAGEPALAGADLVQLERLALSELSRRLAAADGGFRVRVPDGAQAELALGNPGDRDALRAQLATGEPARVESRFLREMLIQHPALGQLCTRAGPPVPFGDAHDTLPAQAERYLYRLRRVDAAGHLSAAAALLDEVVRVPSLARLGAPDLTVGPSQDERLRVRVTARAAFELEWLVMFHESEPLGGPPGPTAPVELVRLGNRRDLLPGGGYRLRRGAIYLSPHATAVTAADVVDGVARVDVELPVGHGLRVRVWALALSRDGIPSLVTGPRTATTARPPIAAPAPTVTRAGARAVVAWAPVAGELEVRVESDGGAGDWRAVSAWLGPGVTAVERPALDAAERFRLAVRTADGRHDVGAAVPVPEP